MVVAHFCSGRKTATGRRPLTDHKGDTGRQNEERRPDGSRLEDRPANNWRSSGRTVAGWGIRGRGMRGAPAT